MPQSLSCPFRFACTHILSHECGHGLHIGRRHQHDETAELLRNTYTGGDRQAQTVDDGGDGQEGDAYQQLLQ